MVRHMRTRMVDVGRSLPIFMCVRMLFVGACVCPIYVRANFLILVRINLPRCFPAIFKADVAVETKLG